MMFNSLDSFILLAVPLFILAANLMNSGKLSEKLISFTNSLVGHIKGGLAHSNVVVSMLFGGISGSPVRSEEHTSELQSRGQLVCRLLLEKKKIGKDTKRATVARYT